MGLRRAPCRLRDHRWRRVRGSDAEVCELCGTRFPCRAIECGHIDCHEADGRPLPDWITEVTAR